MLPAVFAMCSILVPPMKTESHLRGSRVLTFIIAAFKEGSAIKRWVGLPQCKNRFFRQAADLVCCLWVCAFLSFVLRSCCMADTAANEKP